MANKNLTSLKPRKNDRKDDLYRTAKPGDLPLGYEWVPAKIAKPALISQVTMQDYSMSPIFWEGDELTIDSEIETQSGYPMLIQLGELLLIRRFVYREGEPFSYEGSRGERTIVDDKNIVKHWGVVTAVVHAEADHPNGKVEKLDLSKFEYWPDESETGKNDLADAIRCALAA